MIGTVLVAVYGTLKKGFGNHGLMAQAQFLGCDKLTQICLYDIGPYPGARLEASAGIEVEVYAISQSHLAELDLLEEYDPAAPASSCCRPALDWRGCISIRGRYRESPAYAVAHGSR